MPQPRLYKRVQPAGLMSNTAKIIVAPKSPPVAADLLIILPAEHVLNFFRW